MYFRSWPKSLIAFGDNCQESGRTISFEKWICLQVKFLSSY
jgi:hypothetical protein